MKTYVRSIRAMKGTLLIKTLFACLVVAAFSFAAIPTRAGDAEDNARKAFADWKAAKEAVAAAKEKLEEARGKLGTALAAAARSGGKRTPAQEKQLEDLRAEVAAAEAALKDAEARLLAARTALEKAIAELPDGELKEQLKRERNFPSLVTANGLQTVTFDTMSGRVIVNLPDDMRAGDTISGTVVAEPKGNTEEERANNAVKLSKVKLRIGSRFPKDQKDLLLMITPRVITDFSAQLPESFNYTIRLDAPATAEPPVTITITGPIWFVNSETTGAARTVPPAPSSFQLPALGQKGRPVEIFGPFDGNSSNTTLNFNAVRSAVQDFEKNTENVSGGFGLIAESPRKAVFTAPTNVTGPIELHLNEQDIKVQGNYRNVGVNLRAPKTNLLKGERTTLTVQVTGLQGISQPVPLTLDSRGVITMEGGSYQPLVIQPSKVGADGRYSTTREITGVQTGSWTATATVVTKPFDIVLRDPSPPQTLLLNSFTGDYVFCGTGPKLTGTGQIKRQGCVIELTDNKPDRLVQGRVNTCTPVDNGRFFGFYSAGTNTDLVVTVTDTRPPRRKIYFNPLDSPKPPVQDVSAFATCP
jgi:hypothetical protein